MLYGYGVAPIDAPMRVKRHYFPKLFWVGSGRRESCCDLLWDRSVALYSHKIEILRNLQTHKPIRYLKSPESHLKILRLSSYFLLRNFSNSSVFILFLCKWIFYKPKFRSLHSSFLHFSLLLSSHGICRLERNRLLKWVSVLLIIFGSL